MRTRLPLATLVALAASLVPFAAIPAHAQKPALTENIDEKGRVPYHSTVFTSSYYVSCSNPTSPNDTCTVGLKSVPAGYRLVVTHVSVQYQGSSLANTNFVAISGGAANPGELVYTEYLPVPVSAGGYLYISSSPVTYYVEPLGTPAIIVSGIDPGVSFTCSISGYLVSLN
jgi:hypothetical protein